jgi:energy-coupling factor transport system permease protein
MNNLGTFYVPRESWVHRADPRVKLLLVAALWAVLLLRQSFDITLAVLLLLHALHLAARLPRENIGFIWKAFLPMLILIPLLWSVFSGVGAPLSVLGFLRVYPQGAMRGMLLALRLVSMAFALFLWLYTTEPGVMLVGLVKLNIPYPWVLVFSMALHYIPAVQALYHSVSEAQQARGLRLEGGGFQRLRRMMPILVTVMIGGLRMTDQLTRALEARAFGVKGVRRTYLREVRFRPADYAYLAMILLGTAALLMIQVG